MQTKARYLLILIFFVVVIGAMFFIYSTISSPEKVVYFEKAPAWYERAFCVLRGGKVEVITDNSEPVNDCLENNMNANECLEIKTYSCHFH